MLHWIIKLWSWWPSSKVIWSSFLLIRPFALQTLITSIFAYQQTTLTNILAPSCFWEILTISKKMNSYMLKETITLHSFHRIRVSELLTLISAPVGLLSSLAAIFGVCNNKQAVLSNKDKEIISTSGNKAPFFSGHHPKIMWLWDGEIVIKKIHNSLDTVFLQLLISASIRPAKVTLAWLFSP